MDMTDDNSVTARPRSGRPRLDGLGSGNGRYAVFATVSLRPEDIAALEEIGHGNRSAAVRLLLDDWLARQEEEPAFMTLCCNSYRETYSAS